MEETRKDNSAQDHVNTISDTVAVLQFLEELIMVAGAYSPLAITGMEVVIRGAKEKLSSTRNMLMGLHGRSETTDASAETASGVRA